jgi:hypothetical protein
VALINRVAISNALNFFGDGDRKSWSPRIRYECLDFRGQSAALNLTNGGGKTTLSEAILAVLSRDQVLVSNTKKKFSPGSSQVWSHVQVELIRPIGNTGQADLLSDQGNDVNGEHWVFGMYGYKGNESISYYYFQGRLEDLPIGERSNQHKCTLSSNEAFVEKRKSIKGLVSGSRESEWQEALSLKTNLPPSTVKQMSDFQKRGGQDKSALLYNIKARPGQSYAEAFFYKVLAPVIMEGVMDREGEKGEISLEHTVETAVFSTVKAKQDTQARRKEAEELDVGVSLLAELINVGERAAESRSEYERKLSKIKVDVKVLTSLVGGGLLVGVPKASLPDGLTGEIAKHVVIEPGKTDIRILDRGLSPLLGKEPKHVNEHAIRQRISGQENSQVIDFACDLFLQEQASRGNKPKSYSIKDAIELLTSSVSLVSGVTLEAAIEIVEDVEHWFEHIADTNPYRSQLVNHQADIQQSKKEVRELEEEIKCLSDEKSRFSTLKERMEINQGQYNELVQSGLFTEAELEQPLQAGENVHLEHDKAVSDLRTFELLGAELQVYVDDWNDFVNGYGNDKSPATILAEQESLKNQNISARNKLADEIKILFSRKTTSDGKKSETQQNLSRATAAINQLALNRGDYGKFVDQFGNVSPALKERELRDSLSATEKKYESLLEKQKNLTQGVEALTRYYSEVSNEDPNIWLSHTIARRNNLTIEINKANEQYLELKTQRYSLDGESVSANKETRDAYKLLSEKNILFKPLHNVIDSFELTKDRRREVLAVLSALLFAPVIENESQAQLAAEVLAEINILMPVFLYRTILSFCTDSYIEHLNLDQFYVGTTAGIITRSVACILDPELVQREKVKLDNSIEELLGNIENLRKERSKIEEYSEIVLLAKRAELAIKNDEAKSINEVEEKLGKIKTALMKLKEATSEEMINILRNADAYVRAGGQEKDRSLALDIKCYAAEIQDYSEEIEAINIHLNDAEKEKNELDQKADLILSGELKSILNTAIKFYERGGPNFLLTKEIRYSELSNLKLNSANRFAFNKYFSGAQAYIDSVTIGSNEDFLLKRLADTSRSILEKTEALDSTCKMIEVLNGELPGIHVALEAIDRTVILAIKKYKKVSEIGEDIKLGSSINIDSENVIMLAKELAFLIQEKADTEKIKRIADQIAIEIAEYDIDRKADDLRREGGNLKREEQQFVEKAHNIAKSSTGLKQVEKAILQEAKGLASLIQIKSLYEGLLEQLNLITEKLEKCESSELEARQGVTSRLSHLVEYAALDLDILASVVGANRGKHTSYFNVDAEVLDRVGIKGLMDSILSEVDVHEEQRRERESKGIVAPEDELYHESLREKIRDKLYKNIFRNPTITYVNETIRAAGGVNEFNESLSEGQKAALSLMWTIRLADFAIEREAKRLSSRRGQQTARDMSENIILIDGLFSNLSDRSLIDSAMAGIESTRGRFQLIGLIHNEHYQNDYNKFPVFIIGKNESNGLTGDRKKEWVNFNESTMDHASIRTAQIRRIPAPTSETHLLQE